MNWQPFKEVLRKCGIEITRTRNVPVCTFLGLQDQRIDLVLDVGANVGQFAKYCRSFFPSASIHCFEPLPAAARELRQWASSLRDTKVTVWEIALGERRGTAEMMEHTEHPASSSLLQTTEKAVQMFPFTLKQSRREVAIETLDEWVSSHGLDVGAHSLLKLDVQGYETMVLRGARRTLARIGFCILEVTPTPLYRNQSEFSEVVALLADAGLSYVGNLEQFMDAKGFPIYMDVVFARASLLLREPGDAGA